MLCYEWYEKVKGVAVMKEGTMCIELRFGMRPGIEVKVFRYPTRRL